MPSVRRDHGIRCRPARPRIASAAFTLIELLTVIAIIGLLVSFAIGGLYGAKQRSAIAQAKSELAALSQALEDYKRHYGDYPQTGAAAQASQTISGTALIGAAQAQALLFNALTGVYAPTNFTARISGPVFVDVSKFKLEAALNLTTFAVPAGSPPAKPLVANSFLDPWGNRYLYYYKRATPPGGPGLAAANVWQAPGYVLYSAGPDGAQTAPNANTGLYSGTTQTTGTNADNLYADKLP